MAGNSFGHLFRITTYGESHGPAIGVVIDGCPAGLSLSADMIQAELDRRKPGQSRLTTQRKEGDLVEILSGIFEGKTTGTPIALNIRNTDQNPKDYSHIRDRYRPSHADFVWDQKFSIRDYRGGGRSSARETAARVAAGAVAKQLLKHWNVGITAYVHRVKDIAVPENATLNLKQIEDNHIRCPHGETARAMEALILETRKKGDTVGGSIRCLVTQVPAGWGEPVFGKLHAELGKAMLSINAVKAFALGSGFSGTLLYGSEHNDRFENANDRIQTTSNHSGGIQGGISNGMPIEMEVGFKPVATIMQDQETVNRAGEKTTVEGKGRHDPCVLPRAVPIVEAMTALVLADFALMAQTNRLDRL